MDKTVNDIKLSIIIVNYNTLDLALECIRSIYKFRPSCSFEIILVNNGCKGSINKRITAAFRELCTIETGENLGVGKANNLGILNCRGDFILLLNSDTIVTENSPDKMLDYIETNKPVGALGPRGNRCQGNIPPFMRGISDAFFRAVKKKQTWQALIG